MCYKRIIDSAGSYFVLRLFFGKSTCLQVISELLFSIIFRRSHLLDDSWLALLEIEYRCGILKKTFLNL